MIIYYILFAVVFTAILYIKLSYNNRKGSQLEKKIERLFNGLIESKYLMDTGSFTLRDIMLGEENKTSQIDNVLFTPYGCFVIEAKNYKGYIFGSEDQLNWTVTTQSKNKRINKYSFYNPIKQNITHINALKKVIPLNIYSNIVVFGNNATLKKLNIKNHTVIKYSDLKRFILKVFKSNHQVLSKDQLISFKKAILKDIIQDKKQKKRHVKRIKDKYR